MKETVGGFLFIAVACLIAGVFLGLASTGEQKRLNPVDAYCRGYSDAVVYVVASGGGGMAPRVLTDTERDAQEAGCADMVGPDSAPPFARGPLLPE